MLIPGQAVPMECLVVFQGPSCGMGGSLEHSETHVRPIGTGVMGV